MTINLTEHDLDIAREKGIERAMSHPPGDGVNLRYSPVEQHCWGTFGEIAFAKTFGYSYSDVRTDLSNGDGGVDFVMDGVTIDVKTIAYDWPKFAIVSREQVRKSAVDVLVFVTPNSVLKPRSARFIGWKRRARFLELAQQGEPAPVREGDCWIWRNQLSDMETFCRDLSR